MEKSAKESWNILGRAPKCLRYSGSSVDKGPGPVVSAPPGAPTLPSHSQGDTPKCCAGSRRERETHVTKVSTTGGVRIQRENKGRETEQRKHILVIREEKDERRCESKPWAASLHTLPLCSSTVSFGTPKSIPVWRVQSFPDLLLESRISDPCRAARTIEESAPQEGAPWWQG